MEKTFTDTTMLLAAHLAEASLELSPTITGNRGSHGSTHSQGSTEVTLALPSSSITGRKAARSLRIFRGTAEDVKGKLAASTALSKQSSLATAGSSVTMTSSTNSIINTEEELRNELNDLRNDLQFESLDQSNSTSLPTSTSNNAVAVVNAALTSVDHSSQPELQKSIDLEPVSSATYFPHTPADPIAETPSLHQHHEHRDGRHHAPTVISPTAIIAQTQHLTANLEFDHSSNGNITKIMNVSESTEKSKLVEIEKTLISLSKSSSPALEDMKPKLETDIADPNLLHPRETQVPNSEQNELFPLAVELRPFKNKVGGHTAIFSFSKRAVCKALVNRENLFYETIELRHPELLNFMPKYIGVLNVRYSSMITENSSTDIQSDHMNHGKDCGLSRSRKCSSNRLLEAGKYNMSNGNSNNRSHLIASEEEDEFPPEVVLDDNKHIIPDSLWKKYSSSLPSPVADMYLDGTAGSFHNSFHNSIHNSIHNSLLPGENSASSSVTSSHFHTRASNNLGSTSVNTDLQVQVLQEVFQPQLQNTTTNNDDSIFTMDDEELANGKHLDSSCVVSPNMNPSEPPVPGTPTTSTSAPILRKHTRFERFILLEDLTTNMKTPCVLDLKMGTRQYGIEAGRSKQKSQRSKCMYTTSRRLGVRICGLQLSKKPDSSSSNEAHLQSTYFSKDKYFGRRIKIGAQFCKILAKFLYNGQDSYSILVKIPGLITQFNELYGIFHNLVGYRMYGSSILLMYDSDETGDQDVKVRIIDFAQSVISEEDYKDAAIPPSHPNLADLGYLRGIQSLIAYFKLVFRIVSGFEYVDAAGALEVLKKNKSSYMNRNRWLDYFAEVANAKDGGINEVLEEGDPFNVVYPEYDDDDGISE